MDFYVLQKGYVTLDPGPRKRRARGERGCEASAPDRPRTVHFPVEDKQEKAKLN